MGSANNASDFYSGGALFDFRPGYWLSVLMFFVTFLRPSWELPGWDLKLDRKRVLMYYFELFICYYPIIPRCIIRVVINVVIKKRINKDSF